MSWRVRRFTVFARQVLHHARNLEMLCREVSRVLKPHGIFIATREHVISKPEDLARFLKKHPLHQFYGGNMPTYFMIIHPQYPMQVSI